MAWITKTYGQLPSRAQFNRQYAKAIYDAAEGGDGDFHMNLKGDDADVGYATGVYDGPSTYDSDDIWDMLKALTKAFDNGDDKAGDLASSILYTLDIEWV